MTGLCNLIYKFIYKHIHFNFEIRRDSVIHRTLTLKSRA